MLFTKETASLHAKPENTNCTYRLLLWRAKPAILMRWRTIILLRILRSSKYIKNTLNHLMHLVRLMWRSVSESKPVHSRYSRLSQAWRTAEPIQIISAVSNWFRRRTSHELNSLNSIRLMWSTASEPGVNQFKTAIWIWNGSAVLPATLCREFRLWNGFDSDAETFMCRT